MTQKARNTVLSALYANRKDKDYTSPSLDIYPHCFLWDSGFAAILYARFGDPQSAVTELKSVFKGQNNATGFIPNMRFAGKRKLWGDPERHTFTLPDFGSDYSQPPILALAVHETYKSLLELESKESALLFLGDIYEQLAKFYSYFINYRENGKVSFLIGNIHPHETGRDSDPTFDFYKLRLPRNGIKTAKMINTINSLLDYLSTYVINIRLKHINWHPKKARKIFWINDVMFNCIYVDNLRVLSYLAKILDQAWDSEFFRQKADLVEKEILNDMWNKTDNVFYAKNNTKTIYTISISNLFPLVLEHITQKQLDGILKMMEDKQWFDTPYPLPSVPANSKAYDPNYEEKGRIWRGPVWMNMNWYLVERGLLRQLQLHKNNFTLSMRLQKLAKHIAQKSGEMVRNGRGEFHHPETGKSQRLSSFSWANLGYDLELRVLPQLQNAVSSEIV